MFNWIPLIRLTSSNSSLSLNNLRVLSILSHSQLHSLVKPITLILTSSSTQTDHLNRVNSISVISSTGVTLWVTIEPILTYREKRREDSLKIFFCTMLRTISKLGIILSLESTKVNSGMELLLEM